MAASKPDSLGLLLFDFLFDLRALLLLELEMIDTFDVKFAFDSGPNALLYCCFDTDA